MARAPGSRSSVFCPDDTPAVNLGEMRIHGARVHLVDGLIDECGALVARGRAEGRWFDMSTLKEPYRIEGKKTMGLELADQLGWRLPDVIFYPTGGGTGLIGMWKAFAELEALGLIGPERPRMVAVQAEGCAPIVKAWREGAEHAARWENAHTIAAGIRVPRAIGDFLILPRSARAAASRSRFRRRRSPRRSAMRRARRGCCLSRRRRRPRRLRTGRRGRPRPPGRARDPVQLRLGPQISAELTSILPCQGQGRGDQP